MGKNKMLIIIIAAVVVIAVGAVIAVLLLSGGKKNEPAEVVKLEYFFEEAYSNLATDESGKSRIAKYRVCIEYTGDKTLEILDKNKTKLINNFDEIMRTTKYSDLEKSNGKERLRSKMQDMVIETLELDDSIITDVFLQPFVIQ